MEINNIDQLMQAFGNFLNKYYYLAITGGVIITIIIVIIILKIRLKIINKGKPAGSSNTQSMMLQLLIGSNPEILHKMVSDEAKDKEKILEEIKKFNKINEFKKVNDHAMEISVDIDGKEHWYRAKTTNNGDKPRILSLNKMNP